MGVLAFLRKELYASRRKIAILLVVLVVLPGAAAVGTAAFQHTVPENIPVGIAPQSENVTTNEVNVIKGGAAIYASPRVYDSPAEARDALTREEVYIVIEVPHGLFEQGTTTNLTLVSDQRITPFQKPANYTAVALDYRLDELFPADVNVNHTRIGMKYTLSEYLVPTALLSMVMLFSFAYFPFELYQERDVFDRVELSSRIEAAIAAKLIFYAVLLLVPLTVFQLVSAHLGYRINHFDLHALAIIGLTFLYTAAFTAVVMFVTRLRHVGLFLNFAALAGVLTLSSFVYPVGFFSTIRKEIALGMPTYHSMVLTRSALLKDLDLTAFPESTTYVVLVTLGMLISLQLSIMYYRRTA